jgi:hypothetical protein
MNLNRDRAGSNRVTRDGSRAQSRDRAQNIDRSQARDRAQNIDRDRARNRTQNIDRDRSQNRTDRNRDFNLDSNRNYSNRINRNIINTGSRNVIVNPRGGYGGWGWNGGVSWVPSYGYWGGGFWGAFAVGAVTAGVTSAIVSTASNSEPNYVVIQQDSPGYSLFSSYGLTQVPCVDNGTLVYIYGPQDSAVCATPNSLVPAGYYEINPADLTLVAY